MPAKNSLKKASPKAVKKTSKNAPRKSRKISVRNPRTVRHEHFHADGSLWARGKLRGGVMTGYWEFFRKDGTLLRTGEFDEAGEKTGAWTTYDKAGRLYKVTRIKPRGEAVR